MRVRNQQRQIERAFFEFRQQRLSQRAQPSARVQNNDVFTGTDFDTGSIAAVTCRAATRRRNRAANTPKFDLRGYFDGIKLPQPPEKPN